MTAMSEEIVIYHNPACGTSRKVLGLIRDRGYEPRVIEYLKTPPSREELGALVRRIGVPARAILRQKGTPYAALGLDDPALSDEALIEAMERHPILINRPIVVTPLGCASAARPRRCSRSFRRDEVKGPFLEPFPTAYAFAHPPAPGGAWSSSEIVEGEGVFG